MQRIGRDENLEEIGRIWKKLEEYPKKFGSDGMDWTNAEWLQLDEVIDHVTPETAGVVFGEGKPWRKQEHRHTERHGDLELQGQIFRKERISLTFP